MHDIIYRILNHFALNNIGILTSMYLVLVRVNTLEIRLPANTSFPNYGYVMDFPRLWCPRITERIGMKY